MDVPPLQPGLPDRFLDQATRAERLAEAGFDADGIRRAIRERFPHVGA